MLKSRPSKEVAIKRLSYTTGYSETMHGSYRHLVSKASRQSPGKRIMAMAIRLQIIPEAPQELTMSNCGCVKDASNHPQDMQPKYDEASACSHMVHNIMDSPKILHAKLGLLRSVAFLRSVLCRTCFLEEQDLASRDSLDTGELPGIINLS